MMYTVVLLATYHPGLVWQSAQGLAAEMAPQVFVWVHYFCTEKLDLREIYGHGPIPASERRKADDQDRSKQDYELLCYLVIRPPLPSQRRSSLRAQPFCEEVNSAPAS